MINRRRLVNTFKKLVRIDSLSLQEGKLVRYLKKELKSIGVRSYAVGKVKGSKVGNLVAYLPARGMRKPKILLNAHLDTVSPGKNIKPIEK
ncbi:MAG: peptidase M20, partial [Candidatus Margulisiibacteriota bacterium]